MRRRIVKTPSVWMTVLIYLAILTAGLLVVFYYGTRKQGFHEDEIYSFYSSDRTAGIAWPDRGWLETERLSDEMMVLPGEGFRYGLVHTVQSWDVHPPVYYDILHTACSLFPGVFSKWLGIGVNMAAYALCFVLLLLICRECGLSGKFTTLFLAVWAIHPLTISAAMFIRMYLWLTVFVLTCLLLHLRLLRKYTKLRMAGVMAVSLLGFLTHYYYLIFFFFTGVTICLLWFLQRTDDTEATDLSSRVGRIVRYVLLCAASLLAAVLLYPASFSHLFRGYRGREATAAFLSPSGWAGRIAFFGGLVNDWLFSGALGALMLLLIILIIAGAKNPERLQPGTLLTLVPTVCYFLVVSMTALLLGETSNRYLMPVDPLILLLVFSACYHQLRRLMRSVRPEESRDLTARSHRDREYSLVSSPKLRRKLLHWRILRMGVMTLFVGLLFFIDLRGLFVEDHVLFLYPENAATVETARRNRDIPVIVLYNEETPENIWRLYDKLAEFPEVYFMNSMNDEYEMADPAASESRITESPELLVFAADTDGNIDRDARISDLLRWNRQASGREVLWRDAMWTWYRLK